MPMYHMQSHHLENTGTAPVLLDVELASILPRLVLVAEEDDLGASDLLNGLDGHSLVLWGRAGEAIAVAGVGPAGFHDVGVLAGADLLKLSDLLGDEVAGLVGGDLGVEEGVQVGGNDVDDTAEGGAVLLPLSEGLGGGDGAGVASLDEEGLGLSDVGGEVGGGAPAVVDGLVTDNDQLDEVPLAPVDDVPDLFLGSLDALLVNEDAEDELHAVVSCGLAGVLESVAVSAVDADGGEALAGHDGEVLGDSGGILAVSGGGVGRVGHTPGVLAVLTTEGASWLSPVGPVSGSGSLLRWLRVGGCGLNGWLRRSGRPIRPGGRVGGGGLN
jgi:hypothetical protein